MNWGKNFHSPLHSNKKIGKARSVSYLQFPIWNRIILERNCSPSQAPTPPIFWTQRCITVFTRGHDFYLLNYINPKHISDSIKIHFIIILWCMPMSFNWSLPFKYFPSLLCPILLIFLHLITYRYLMSTNMKLQHSVLKTLYVFLLGQNTEFHTHTK